MEVKTNWYTKTESNQPIIADEETGNTIAVIYNQKDGSEKQIANLIASAPELLEALEKLLKSHRQLTFEQNHNVNDTPVEVFAQTVINKAKGDTSC